MGSDPGYFLKSFSTLAIEHNFNNSRVIKWKIKFGLTMRRDLLNNVLRLWAGIFLLNI